MAETITAQLDTCASKRDEIAAKLPKLRERFELAQRTCVDQEREVRELAKATTLDSTTANEKALKAARAELQKLRERAAEFHADVAAAEEVDSDLVARIARLEDLRRGEKRSRRMSRLQAGEAEAERTFLESMTFLCLLNQERGGAYCAGVDYLEYRFKARILPEAMLVRMKKLREQIDAGGGEP